MLSKLQSVIFPTIVLCTAIYGRNAFTDKEIADAVRDELRFDPGVSAHLITVTADDGIVTMTGDVGSLPEADRAVLLAETIRGVRGIVNDLSLHPVTRTDAEITADLREAYRMDPVADAMQLDFRVDDGVVYLTGTVTSIAERDLVGRVTKTVKGVRGVENQLRVSIDPKRPDDEIKAEIWKRLRFDPYLQGSEISVTVEDGVADLEGTVRSLPVYRRVIRQAMVTGVTDIQSIGLIVDPMAGRRMKRDSISVTMPDSVIENSVRKVLADQPETPVDGIRVQSREGVVSLYGMVNNLRAKNMAREAAQNTVGVQEVRSFIKVRPTSDKSDQALVADIANAFRWNPYLERFALNVHVRNNKAYLYGEVDSYFEKMQAGKAASRIAGVVAVENGLSVRRRPRRDLSDSEIRNRVENKLTYSSLVSAGDITVRVEDGIATLSGTVSSVDALNAAVHGAFGGGARGVRSELEVEGFLGDSPRMPENYEWDSYVWP